MHAATMECDFALGGRPFMTFEPRGRVYSQQWILWTGRGGTRRCGRPHSISEAEHRMHVLDMLYYEMRFFYS
jgi:hypothetical protein